MALNRRSFLKFSLIGALSSLLPVSWRGVPRAAAKHPTPEQFRAIRRAVAGAEPIVPAYFVRGHADAIQDEVATKMLTKGTNPFYSKLGT